MNHSSPRKRFGGQEASEGTTSFVGSVATPVRLNTTEVADAHNLPHRVNTPRGEEVNVLGVFLPFLFFA
jgi:hypothetical protein